jgi:hypothetical protein
MKNECSRQILIPLTHRVIRREIALYVTWYNQHRPSEALDGKTPLEVYGRLPPANSKPRLEPRPRWPRHSPCASPQIGIKEARGAELRLVVSYLERRAHLPIVELRKAA